MGAMTANRSECEPRIPRSYSASLAEFATPLSEAIRLMLGYRDQAAKPYSREYKVIRGTLSSSTLEVYNPRGSIYCPFKDSGSKNYTRHGF